MKENEELFEEKKYFLEMFFKHFKKLFIKLFSGKVGGGMKKTGIRKAEKSRLVATSGKGEKS